MSDLCIPVKHNSPHWNHWTAFYTYCSSTNPVGIYLTRNGRQKEMDKIAEILKKFNGELVYNTHSLPGIVGLKFNTTDDLLIFKLTFN